jgi:hypothetical protein
LHAKSDNVPNIFVFKVFFFFCLFSTMKKVLMDVVLTGQTNMFVVCQQKENGTFRMDQLKSGLF